ncbi:MAG: sulfurtransferase [Carnobacterium sp.]|uniref:sulfurtransferase n=1 Tax=Carnobacterium sp. TaxID=48221 RepID=UPI0033158300
MKNFVTQTWLLENCSNNDLILLDARAELNDPKAGYNQYKTGHIKRAQFVSLEDTMTGKVSEHGGRHPLPDMEVFIKEMKQLGISDSSTVIIYDNGDLAMAGRLWWLLRYAGKDKVFLLEGGIKHWVDNGLELTIVFPEPQASGDLRLNLNESMIAEHSEVKAAVDLDQTAIIDSRAYERYSGQVEPLDKLPGHIPSALNYPWMDLVDEGTIIDNKNINEKFKSLEEYEDIIVHCGSGITGTVNVLFMEEAGLEPRLYLGGYSDWVSYENSQVVKD